MMTMLKSPLTALKVARKPNHPPNTKYNGVLLGNCLYFSMPSIKAWDLALFVAMDLHQIANRIAKHKPSVVCCPFLLQPMP
jgi:hypothetical protein